MVTSMSVTFAVRDTQIDRFSIKKGQFLGLVEGKIATENEIATMHEEITARMTEIMKLAINDEISPRMDLTKNPEAISSIMFHLT